MPFALVTIGLMMIVSGSRDTYAAFGKELIADFTGEGNFLNWMLAIGALGALGSVKEFQGFSRAFMALVLVSMVLANRGAAAKVTEAIEKGPIRPQQPGDDAKTIGSGSTYNMPDYGAFIDKIRKQSREDVEENYDRFKEIVGIFI